MCKVTTFYRTFHRLIRNNTMAVEIRVVNNQKGKGLFAKRDIANESVLFEEDPLVCCQFAWNESYGYKACNHCMRPLETAEENARRLTNKWNLVLPYPQCCETDKSSIVECNACGVKYCSENCQMTAFQQYHKAICFQTKERNCVHPLEKVVEAWKDLHFPPETCNIMLVARIIAMVQLAPELRDQFMGFCHRTVNEDASLAHKLVGEPFIGQIKMLNHLISSTFPNSHEHWLTEEGFKTLLALIGTNGQGVGTSAISRWVKNVTSLPEVQDPKSPARIELDTFIEKLYEDLEKESGLGFLNNEGSALYTLQSACNHSCVPNAQPHFDHNNFRLTMKAMRDIKAGDEIYISYLDDCMLERSRYSRRKFLAEHYLFLCNCEKCMAETDEPDLTSEEEMSEDDEK